MPDIHTGAYRPPVTTTGGRVGGQRPGVLFGSTVAVAFALTVVVLLLPSGDGAVDSPLLRVALETANTIVALLVAFLVYGRFRRSGRAQELLLVLGLCAVAVGNLALTALPSASVETADLTRWAALPVRLLGTLLIATAALTPWSVRWYRREARVAVLATGGALLVVGALGALWSRSRFDVMAPFPGSNGVAGYRPGDDWTVFGAQLLGAALYGVAALALLRQARTRHDELIRWMAAGFVLAAAARVHYSMFPSLYLDYVYTGDVLRLGFYVCLLVGASREIESYWRLQSHAAVLADRRRVARELHDGVIQELAYIRSESHAIPPASAGREGIMRACDRALDEARAAVQALGHDSDEALGATLRRAAEELAARYQTDVELDLDDSVGADPDQRHALMRITREAVVNASRHGKATAVRIGLHQHDGGRRLTIEDDGKGFDVDQATASAAGYGLISMRDRARGLPGSFHIRAEPGVGSVVTVRW